MWQVYLQWTSPLLPCSVLRVYNTTVGDCACNCRATRDCFFTEKTVTCATSATFSRRPVERMTECGWVRRNIVRLCLAGSGPSCVNDWPSSAAAESSPRFLPTAPSRTDQPSRYVRRPTSQRLFSWGAPWKIKRNLRLFITTLGILYPLAVAELNSLDARLLVYWCDAFRKPYCEVW